MLFRSFEDCLKRFYNFYGQPMQNQNKRAQSISDEIHGQDSTSFILPYQMLNCRVALCDEINRIFGTDISVKFSPLWALEFNALVVRDTNGNGTADIEEGSEEDVDNDDVTEPDNGAGEGSGETEKEPVDGDEGNETEETGGTEEGTEEGNGTGEELKPDEEEPTDIPAMELDPEPDPDDEPMTPEEMAAALNRSE